MIKLDHCPIALSPTNVNELIIIPIASLHLVTWKLIHNSMNHMKMGKLAIQNQNEFLLHYWTYKYEWSSEGTIFIWQLSIN